MAKLLAKGAIAGAVNLWSRHATPKKFCHVLLQGVNGRAFKNHVNLNAALYVLWHPGKTWAAMSDLYKAPDGGPMHVFRGQPTPPVPDNGSAIPGDANGRLYAWPGIDDIDVIELYLPMHIEKYLNDTDRNGARYWGAVYSGVSAAGIRNAIDAAGMPWITGEDWGAVDNRYKKDDGSSLVDPDDAVDVKTVAWAGAADPE